METGCEAMAEGGEGTTNKTCLAWETFPFLPVDLFTEILSWLPVKSVLVSKCVCKDWKLLTEETTFIMKHKNRGRTIILSVKPDFYMMSNKFNICFFSEGLALERRGPFNYRIRNPATRQVLLLPDPARKLGHIYLFYVSGSMEYKLIHCYAKGLGSQELCCEVLTVGDDLAWRGLNVPTLKKIYEGNPKIFYGYGGGIDTFHFIRIPLDGPAHPEIVILDLVTECASCYIIPRKFFWNWNNVCCLSWNGKLALAAIVRDKLIVWVLENKKINLWADREIIIPLTSASYYLTLGNNVRPLSLSGNILYINIDYRTFMEYDIEEKKVKKIALKPFWQNSWLKFRPCLVQLKGMHPEVESIEG